MTIKLERFPFKFFFLIRELEIKISINLISLVVIEGIPRHVHDVFIGVNQVFETEIEPSAAPGEIVRKSEAVTRGRDICPGVGVIGFPALQGVLGHEVPIAEGLEHRGEIQYLLVEKVGNIGNLGVSASRDLVVGEENGPIEGGRQVEHLVEFDLGGEGDVIEAFKPRGIIKIIRSTACRNGRVIRT